MRWFCCCNVEVLQKMVSLSRNVSPELISIFVVLWFSVIWFVCSRFSVVEWWLKWGWDNVHFVICKKGQRQTEKNLDKGHHQGYELLLFALYGILEWWNRIHAWTQFGIRWKKESVLWWWVFLLRFLRAAKADLGDGKSVTRSTASQFHTFHCSEGIRGSRGEAWEDIWLWLQ